LTVLIRLTPQVHYGWVSDSANSKQVFSKPKQENIVRIHHGGEVDAPEQAPDQGQSTWLLKS